MAAAKPLDKTPLTQSELFSALLPWIIVCVVMLIWGNGAFKTWANAIFTWNYPVPDLHNMINVVALTYRAIVPPQNNGADKKSPRRCRPRGDFSLAPGAGLTSRPSP